MGALAKFIGVLIFLGSLYGSYQIAMSYGWIQGYSMVPQNMAGWYIIANLIFYIIAIGLIKKE